MVKGKWRAATEAASAYFIRAQSRDFGRKNGGVYDDDGVGYTGKSNTAVEDVERRPEEMWNDGNNIRRDDRGDEDGGSKDEGTKETEVSEERQKRSTSLSVRRVERRNPM